MDNSNYLQLLPKSVPIYGGSDYLSLLPQSKMIRGGSDYLSLLPKDINNIVEEYKIINNPNNQILIHLLDLIRWKNLGTKDPNIIEEMNKYFLTIGDFHTRSLNNFFYNNGLDISFEAEVVDDSWELIDIPIGKLPLIDDKLMAKILLALVENNYDPLCFLNRLNRFLYQQKSPFILADVGIETPHFIVMYGGNVEGK